MLQLNRVDEFTTFVTLVAPSVIVRTQRTNSFHKSIREKSNSYTMNHTLYIITIKRISIMELKVTTPTEQSFLQMNAGTFWLSILDQILSQTLQCFDTIGWAAGRASGL